MKKLKLNHIASERVRSGSQTSTWRLYDDKDIRVNDKLELLDKVDPADPSTWLPVGVVEVSAVIEKRIGAVQASDLDDQQFKSTDELLDDCRRFYGPQADLATPIKIIHFALPQGQEDRPNNQLQLKEVNLYADGGSRGNPGPSASGFIIETMDGRIIVKKGIYLGVTTNNQAEYQALKLGFEEALGMGIRTVHVYMDSLLVINQMLGIFKVKNRDLWPIHDSIKDLRRSFHEVTFTHVPRELNKLADAAVNEALDAAAARQ